MTLQRPTTALRQRVVVRPGVPLRLLDEIAIDERVEVRVQPAVVNARPVVRLQLLLDREPLLVVLSIEDPEDVAPERGQIGERSRTAQVDVIAARHALTHRAPPARRAGTC